MTQNDQIIKFLSPPGRKLTRLTCFQRFGFMTLNSRAPEIRAKGYPIISRLITNKQGVRYSEYYFR